MQNLHGNVLDANTTTVQRLMDGAAAAAALSNATQLVRSLPLHTYGSHKILVHTCDSHFAVMWKL